MQLPPVFAGTGYLGQDVILGVRAASGQLADTVPSAIDAERNPGRVEATKTPRTGSSWGHSPIIQQPLAGAASIVWGGQPSSSSFA